MHGKSTSPLARLEGSSKVSREQFVEILKAIDSGLRALPATAQVSSLLPSPTGSAGHFRLAASGLIYGTLINDSHRQNVNIWWAASPLAAAALLALLEEPSACLSLGQKALPMLFVLFLFGAGGQAARPAPGRETLSMHA
eukprot:1160776-Pelagomonas_calceolata.AAC.4